MRGVAAPPEPKPKNQLWLGVFNLTRNAPPKSTHKGFTMADKKVPSAEVLAAAWRKSPGFCAPYWHDGEWIWLSPHGDARTKCGSPIRPPKVKDVKPHEQQLWEKCWKCNTIRPWGGCGGKFPQPTWAFSMLVDVDKTPKAKPEPGLADVDSPNALLVVLEKMAASGTFGNWLLSLIHISEPTRPY